jgi:hypothetical protein
MSVSKLLPLGGANDFNVAISGTNTSVTFTKEYSPGAYTITSTGSDTTFDIYAYNASGALAGYTNNAALSTTIGFNKLVIIGHTSGTLLSFTYKTTYTTTDVATEVLAGPVATSVSPSAVPKIDDTFTLTGRNFATNATVTFSSTTGVYTSALAKAVTRSSATSLIVTRPDLFPIGNSPYTITVQNPGVTNPTGSNSHILSNSITAGVAPVWVTGAVLSYTTGTATSFTLSATDADAGSAITYSIASGTLPTGLSLAGAVVSGTPSTSQQTVTFRATDSGGNFVDKAIRFNAVPAITTTSPLSGYAASVAYSSQLVATDDLATSAITWSLASGTLPSGFTLSSAGLISGTTTTTGTSSFTVTATDADGGAVSKALTVEPAPIGGTLYQTVGTYTFTVPTKVFEIDVIAVGGGGGGGNGNSGHAGGGGGLGWKNNIAVTPGQTYTVVVGSGGASSANSTVVAGDGTVSYFNTTSVVRGGGGQGAAENPTETSLRYIATGGTYTGDGGGNGGAGGYDTGNNGGSGGGGAAGYTGAGGYGGNNGNSGSSYFASLAGAGGGGGGGGMNQNSNGSGGGGGGVGIYGQGSNGAAVANRGFGSAIAGKAGSNGTDGGGPPDDATSQGGNGGLYGGGGGGSNQNYAGGTGGRGAVRIIWGPGRSFPSTNVGQNYTGVSETVI